MDADADASQGGLTPGVRDRSFGGGADGDGHEGRSRDVRFTRLILILITFKVRRYIRDLVRRNPCDTYVPLKVNVSGPPAP